MPNQKFVDEVYGLSRPLAVYSMDEAASVIAKALDARREDDNEAFGRHLAWLIGFDALLSDRKRLRDLSSFMVSTDA